MEFSAWTRGGGVTLRGSILPDRMNQQEIPHRPVLGLFVSGVETGQGKGEIGKMMLKATEVFGLIQALKSRGEYQATRSRAQRKTETFQVSWADNALYFNYSTQEKKAGGQILFTQLPGLIYLLEQWFERITKFITDTEIFVYCTEKGLPTSAFLGGDADLGTAMQNAVTDLQQPQQSQQPQYSPPAQQPAPQYSPPAPQPAPQYSPPAPQPAPQYSPPAPQPAPQQQSSPAATSGSGSDTEYLLFIVTVQRVTQKALQIQFDNGREIWIPKSIAQLPPNVAVNQSIEIGVPKWWWDQQDGT